MRLFSCHTFRHTLHLLKNEKNKQFTHHSKKYSKFKYKHEFWRTCGKLWRNVYCLNPLIQRITDITRTFFSSTTQIFTRYSRTLDVFCYFVWAIKSLITWNSWAMNRIQVSDYSMLFDFCFDILSSNSVMN